MLVIPSHSRNIVHVVADKDFVSSRVCLLITLERVVNRLIALALGVLLANIGDGKT